MPIPVRGLRTIRTLAGRVDHHCVPHRMHLQIAVLEIEKTRRVSERTGASRRVAELDARLRTIEAEEAVLVQRLADRDKGKRVVAAGTERATAPPRSAGTLKIRY